MGLAAWLTNRDFEIDPSQRLFWPFADPAALCGTPAEILEGTRRIRDEIDAKICGWLEGQGIIPRPLP